MSFSINTASSTPQTLVDGDYGFIGPTGVLFVPAGSAITGSGANELTILGTVANTNTFSDVISLSGGGDISINVAASGYIGGHNVNASGILASAQSGDDLELNNSGTIHNGVILRNYTTLGNIQLANTGTLTDTLQVTGPEEVNVINTGTITGDLWGVHLSTSSTWRSATLINDGTIAGLGTAVAGGANADLVRNSGTLSGNVDLDDGYNRFFNTGALNGDYAGGTGNDQVYGTGLFNGDIDLGDGTNRLILTGAEVRGTIRSGIGDDTFILRDGAQASGIVDLDGNDSYTIFQQVEILDLGTGIDTVTAWVNCELADSIENLVLRGGEDLKGIGNALDNEITGNQQSNRLGGREGNDTINGLAGNDTIFAGDGDDTVSGGYGNDVIRGGYGADTLSGNGGNDTIYGGFGPDTMTGGYGRDAFIFLRAAETGAQLTWADRITDFGHGIDKINLAAVYGGRLIYSYNGSFSSNGPSLYTKHVGADMRVYVDVNGDRQADMLIVVENRSLLTASDFVL